MQRATRPRANEISVGSGTCGRVYGTVGCAAYTWVWGASELLGSVGTLWSSVPMCVRDDVSEQFAIPIALSRRARAYISSAARAYRDVYRRVYRTGTDRWYPHRTTGSVHRDRDRH